MVAVGVPAFEAYWGLEDGSACKTNQDCFWLGNPPRAMIGTNAGTFYGDEHGVPPSVGGSGCWIFLYYDSSGWHFASGVCTQASGTMPGLYDRVYVVQGTCANVRTAPSMSSKVVACLSRGTQVDVDSAPVYADSHIWWHLTGRGWMAHDFLVWPKGVYT